VLPPGHFVKVRIELGAKSELSTAPDQILALVEVQAVDEDVTFGGLRRAKRGAFLTKHESSERAKNSREG